MIFGSLFAGIGGLDLGLERAGWRCIWQVEKDEFCNRVLERHWPSVTRYGDIQSVDAGKLRGVDALCGGFPCQDISTAGRGGGLAGARSGLWWDYYRIIDHVRPRYVIIENVAALIVRGLPAILSQLAELGYDAEWTIVSARQFALPHYRRRLFIIAYPNGGMRAKSKSDPSSIADFTSDGIWGSICREAKDGFDIRRGLVEVCSTLGFPASVPATYGIINGIPDRLDRLRVCGNAVVPAIAHWIGSCINGLEGR